MAAPNGVPERIEVCEYDPQWPVEFEQLRGVLWPVLRDIATAIEHVGSTSVIGMAAKPILDIDVIVPDADAVKESIEVLASLGWVHRGDLGIAGREAFVRHPDYFAHNLYVCLEDCDSLTNHLVLRDHLRRSPAAVEEYAALKRSLAERHPYDIGAYVEGKTAFIVHALAANGMASDALVDITQANRHDGPTRGGRLDNDGAVSIAWRGEFTSAEANALHADAFETREFSAEEWDWREQVETHSMGWVTARSETGALVGFVNVLWDGLVHAWIQDVMVAAAIRHAGIGVRIVHAARDAAAEAGCEWLHVDFDDELKPFYFDACGFSPTTAGLIEL